MHGHHDAAFLRREIGKIDNPFRARLDGSVDRVALDELHVLDGRSDDEHSLGTFERIPKAIGIAKIAEDREGDGLDRLRFREASDERPGSFSRAGQALQDPGPELAGRSDNED